MLASVMAGEQDYAGDVSIAEAWNHLSTNSDAQLIDVRTQPEWSFVGVPDLGGLGRRPVFVSWQMYPDMTVNPRFVEELRAQGIKSGQPLYFLCRSGARSRAAALVTLRGEQLHAEADAEQRPTGGGEPPDRIVETGRREALDRGAKRPDAG